MLDLLGFILGERNHRKPAVITTNVFEIHISYDGLHIETAEGSREVP